MEHQGQSGVPGPAGRRLHIAHRRSPSEVTPMIMEQLALQQQIELLQQQQQQIAATHQQYVNMGMIPQQQQLPSVNYPVGTNGSSLVGLQQFQFPQMQQQSQNPTMAMPNVSQGPSSLGVPTGGPAQGSVHRRNQSAIPSVSMGPPPAPSSGSAGHNADFGHAGSHNRENSNHRGGRGGGGNNAGSGGHQRRHSLALPEAKKAAELAQSKRAAPGFQFPIPGASGASPATTNRSISPSHSDDKGSLAPPQSNAGAGLSVRAGNRGGASLHGRSQSLAVGGRGGNRNANGFQFPVPPSSTDGGLTAPASDTHRRGSSTAGHARTMSRNFDGNWRQPSNHMSQGSDASGLQQQQQQVMGQFAPNPNPAAASFQPGHRPRGSMNQSISSLAGFQFPNQTPLVQLQQGQLMLPQQQQMLGGQQLHPLQLSQLQALQAAQMSGNFSGLAASQHAGPQLSMTPQQQQQQQQQQRKTLFTPYLPQASLPALLADGQLVSGILRVNKKNRSDAYVMSVDLDADIFVCGSKDRNRALEGDFVAIELLDVDEVWSQKREKEEKKKRKDLTDSRIGNSHGSDRGGRSESANGDGHGGNEGGLRRRGSLRQRPTQKKNDDVEVEGQSLLLMEEEEINDEQKPLYAGHVVAVIDRIAGQMFSGTLGLLRPSSQATKEKQEAERQHRDGNAGRQPDRQQDKPKIVWFKPTDKRVPLIAIPTEQAPRDFVERHAEYANRIFVACIKRWPITSLHPFGTLVEQLGEMGDLKVETDALLRDNNFGPDDFSEAVLKSIGFEDWTVESEDQEMIKARRDLRSERIFTIDAVGTNELDNACHAKELANGNVEIGVHVADVAHFIRANSLVDREAKKRGTGVFLINRVVNMLPSKLTAGPCALSPDQDRLAVSVIFQVDQATGKLVDEKPWIGRSVIRSTGKITQDQVEATIEGSQGTNQALAKDVQLLESLAHLFRASRYEAKDGKAPPLRLLHQLDDEDVPVQKNIFRAAPAQVISEELTYLAEAIVATKIYESMPEKALLRQQAPPKMGRLQTFGERMTRVGFEIDTTSSATLHKSLFNVQDEQLRLGMETLLLKTMTRAKYVVAGRTRSEQLPHFELNVPLFTHFGNPFRRYADIVVHRQLEAALAGSDYNEDLDSLVKTTEQCNTKKDSAQSAEEQSVHIELCRIMDRKRQKLNTDLISEGIVTCVYESAFDVVIPEFGYEKRVHCDQLPLRKAEFRKEKRVLELYWEKGVASSAFVPEDERPKGRSRAAAARDSNSSIRPSKGGSVPRKQPETGTMSTDDVDALFDDEDDGTSELNDMTAGVSLAPTASRSMPQSPERTGNGTGSTGLHRTQSELKLGSPTTDNHFGNDTERMRSTFKLREHGGDYIQDVMEMSRVPVILTTDLTKSPPCLTIRSVNPYAL